MREWLISQRGNQSQKSVAQKVNISRGAYANIELGKRNPSVQLAKKIAQELNFDWTIFLKKKLSKRNKKLKIQPNKSCNQGGISYESHLEKRTAV